MRSLLTVVAVLVCAACCRADESPERSSADRSASLEPRATESLSPVLLQELERIVQSVLEGSAKEAIELELAVRDDDDRDPPPPEDRRPPRRRPSYDRREEDRRHLDGDVGPGHRGGMPGPLPDQGPHRGPGPQPGGPGHAGGPGPGPGGPGPHPHDGAPHTINVHIFFHHEFPGGHPAAMRFLMGGGRQGEMHGPPPGRRGRQRDEDDNEEEDRDAEEERGGQEGERLLSLEKDAEISSLRDDVASLRKELAELSALVRRLAQDRDHDAAAH
ncbi:MAG TPA: hypothetical protein VHC22_07840 [Pirellulales bacterium]|nr:hypothetical protein [Pirellulales bacterium]